MIAEKDFKIMVPYDDYNALVNDAAKLVSVIGILETEFPDDTCQLIALKSILGIKDPEPEPEPDDPDNTDPSDPGTDPSDPGDGGATSDPVDPSSGDPTP